MVVCYHDRPLHFLCICCCCVVSALLTIHDVDPHSPLSAVFGLESHPLWTRWRRYHLQPPHPPYCRWIACSTCLLVSLSLKLCHFWQVPLGSPGRGKFPAWTTISSAWGSFVSWRKAACCWRAARMMVCLTKQHNTETVWRPWMTFPTDVEASLRSTTC